MENKYEIFSTWWHASEQEELRKYCATGWGWKIWQAITELQNEEQNIPEIIPGWKLVPIEPTKEMRQQIHPIAVGTCHHCYATVNPDCEDNVLLSWRDMLAAAPEVTSGTTD